MIKLTRTRNHQIIGFFVVILMLLILAPYIFSDKSSEEKTKIVINDEEPRASIDDELFTNNTQIIQDDNDELALLANSLEEAQQNIIEPDVSTINDQLSIDDLLQSPQVTQTRVVQPAANQPTVNVQTPQVQRTTNNSSAKYYVRLAALSNQANLNEKRKTLEANHYPIDTRVNGKVTILMIGPYQTDAEAKQNLLRVQKIFNDINDAKVIQE